VVADCPILLKSDLAVNYFNLKISGSFAGGRCFMILTIKPASAIREGINLYPWVLYRVVMMSTIHRRRDPWIGTFAPRFKFVSNDEI
jgi:hypothetical protein